MSAYTQSARAAGYDPKKYAGTKLSILMTGDENDHRALGDLLPQLEAETGIKLEITSPALGALIEKTLQNLKADKSSFELIEYLGFLTTQQVGGGYFEQLNSYIDDANETPPDWDFKDFIPGAMKNVGIYDLKNHTLGQGSDVYGIPGLHSGSVIYFYRKDLFDAAGLKPVQDLGRFQVVSAEAEQGRRRGLQFHRRQRLFACRRRLVHPLHHHRRRSDERRSKWQGLPPARRFARSASTLCRC